MMRRRPYLFNLLALACALLLSVAVGSVFVSPAALAGMVLWRFPGLTIHATWPEAHQVIVFQLRLPHTALMALTGAALASSGAAYQGLFRNPLADPYLIGVASGAGLGAVLALTMNWPGNLLGLYTIPASAFLGAVVTVAIVYSLARVGRTVPTTTLILAGVAFSAFATALTSYLMFRSNSELRRSMGWLFGGGTLGGWEPVWAILPYIVVGVTVLVLAGHALNVLQFGEEQAQQLGLPAERVKILVILAASLTTAAAVAFTGIIGFIGLVVPHVARIAWGTDYRRLIPLSLLGGATALLLADLVARVALAPETLPVGIVTALVGAPFFLWILRQAKAQAYW